TPGGAGSVHYAFQQGLIGLFGIDKDLASAATVIYHPVLVYIPPIVFGLMFAWRDGLTPGTLRAAAAAGEGGPGGSQEAGEGTATAVATVAPVRGDRAPQERGDGERVSSTNPERLESGS